MLNNPFAGLSPVPIMIAQLRGTLLDKRPNQVLVDVGGVGYQVHIPLSTYYSLGDLHGPVTLLIHTHLRDDGISLYGFLSSREKQCFELLIGASGVGPVLAMKILSGMNVEELIPAIRSGDLAALTRIPGVGKKTAERIVVELRDKLAAMETHEPPRAASPQGPAADVVSALINLGYEERDAKRVVEDAQRDVGTEFEGLLKASLQRLTPSREGHKRAAGQV
ncbi:MAG TPA: Holliday junction branch migration protein RuvA [Candidatus Acidoferrales bacterium]|nr:Holliday junction branch migration protein RuvA [Candidatus Acidoferrales bacterium]